MRGRRDHKNLTSPYNRGGGGPKLKKIILTYGPSSKGHRLFRNFPKIIISHLDEDDEIHLLYTKLCV